jgi:hypothetical protein
MAKQRMQEIRVTRSGTARQRSVCGGTVVGDYVDPTNGERVLIVKVVSATKVAAKVKPKSKPASESLDFVRPD